jgi:hypothetical protein
VAECQDDRSQHRNKAKAMAVLAARLREKERSERAAKEAATRKGLIGSGDRSDRIRTYNFPQGRLTDHRINLTLYKLAQIMEGDLTDVVAALQAARAELLASWTQRPRRHRAMLRRAVADSEIITKSPFNCGPHAPALLQGAPHERHPTTHRRASSNPATSCCS